MLLMPTKGLSTTEKEKAEMKAVEWPNLLMGGRGEGKRQEERGGNHTPQGTTRMLERPGFHI